MVVQVLTHRVWTALSVVGELQKIFSFARCYFKSEIRNQIPPVLYDFFRSSNLDLDKTIERGPPLAQKKGAACVAHPLFRGLSEFRPQLPGPIPVPRREAISSSQRVENIHVLV